MTELQKLKEAVHAIPDLNIYEGLTDQEILCVAKSSKDEALGQATPIYAPGDTLAYIYVLHRGEVQLYHMVNGKKVIFDVLTPGAVFGAFDFEHPEATHYAEMTRAGELCVTPVSEFLELVKAHPEMLLRLLQKTAAKVQDYEQKLEAAAGTAEDKILFELQRQKEKRSRNFFGKFFPVRFRMTHEQIAAYTGLNRITVTRTLKTLREKGLVKGDGGVELV